jgi:MFS family permease
LTVRGGPWVALLVLCSVQFLVLLDSLMVALALPSIGNDLGLGPAGLQWVLNAFAVALGGFLLLGGRAADLFGRRRVMLAGLVLLTIGGLAAAAAPAAAVLLAGRAVQGLGAALAFPSSLAAIPALFPDEPWRSRGFAGASIAGSTAAIVGAVFGGIVTGLLGWAWVFLIGSALTAAAVVAVVVLIREPEPPAASGPLDLPGALAVTAGVTVLAFGIVQGEHAGLVSVRVLGPLAVASALLGAFAVIERRAPRPLVPPRLLRSRQVVGASLGLAAASAAYTAAVFVGALYLQRARALPPASPGFALVPAMVASAAAGLAGAPVVRRVGARQLSMLGLLTCAATFAVLANARGSRSYVVEVVPPLVLFGVGVTVTYLALTRHALGTSAFQDHGVASGVFEAATHLGGALAVAIYATMLGSSAGFAGAFSAAVVLTVAGALSVGFLLRG